MVIPINTQTIQTTNTALYQSLSISWSEYVAVLWSAKATANVQPTAIKTLDTTASNLSTPTARSHEQSQLSNSPQKNSARSAADLSQGKGQDFCENFSQKQRQIACDLTCTRCPTSQAAQDTSKHESKKRPKRAQKRRRKHGEIEPQSMLAIYDRTFSPVMNGAWTRLMTRVDAANGASSDCAANTRLPKSRTVRTSKLLKI